jgi:hypothetical protein
MSLANILWLVVVVVVALWLIGLLANVAGNLAHLPLLVAVAVVLYSLFAGRRGCSAACAWPRTSCCAGTRGRRCAGCDGGAG